ncbi:cyclin-D4-1-like isoform X2 [Salvia divinorum]|uniref:Cyclin-D4-1-like isoform X2 n=1 Tax=Salvia divinorum TaxID=28513 RepID=A0ABD1IKK6_SALDI
MAENRGFDCGAASDLLLCDEETKSLCFDDGDFVETLNDQIHHQTGSDSGPFIPLPFLSEECVDWMVEREREHLPRNDYLMRLRSGELDLSLRREALDWMFKACAHHNFGEFCLYLAMNYLDRFLSLYSLPKGKHWVIQLIAVSCLSLAAKMEEVTVPSLVDLQAGDPKFLFEAKTIQRMEVLVLSYLNWNVKPYTPFNFIEFYLRKTCKTRIPQGQLLTRSTQIIMSMIKGIDFLEFKPSEIAAAVALHVSGAVDAAQEKVGRVAKCLELIQDLMPISGAAALTASTTTSVASRSSSSSSTSPSLPYSPNGVLDAACLSYKSDERSSPICKRRKLDQDGASS